MKLSDTTINILKNFSAINTSMVLRPGQTQRTMTQGQNILATAVIAEDIPRECPIYNLQKLLGLLSLFDEPDVEFHPNYLTIAAGNASVKFAYADASVVTGVSKQFTMPPKFLTFSLERDALKKLANAASVLNAQDIEIVFGADGKPGIAAVADIKNASSDRYEMVPSEFSVNDPALTDCRVVFKNEYLKVLPGDYDIALATKKAKNGDLLIIAEFTNKTTPVVYHIAAEPNPSTVTIGEAVTV